MKLLTLARDLKRRKARERLSLFVAEGVRAVEELLDSPIELRGVLTSSELPSSARGAMLLEQLHQRRDLDLLEVNESDFASAADTDAPQGVLAIAAVPDRSLEQIPSDGAMRLLVLDAVQDPGNVGTILRTAAAFGATATIALPGTVDLWNAKVVRSAMGALFHHLALSSTWEALDAFLSAREVGVWGADAAGATVDSIATSPERLALIVGNEGAGLSAAARARATKIVSLPISPAVESLNVAVAAGVLLYELRPARSRPS